MKESRTAFILLVVLGPPVGAVLALGFFALLRARGMDLYLALPLAASAFFFGIVLVSTILRIVFGVLFLWRRRR